MSNISAKKNREGANGFLEILLEVNHSHGSGKNRKQKFKIEREFGLPAQFVSVEKIVNFEKNSKNFVVVSRRLGNLN